MDNLQSRFSDTLTAIVEKHELDFDRIAVAVSGGADSLALAFLLNRIARESATKITALTVNHHLRPEADAEAEYVAELMQKNGIEHHILHWRHPPLAAGIETKAREARYQLLFDWCRDNGFSVLMTAHHLRDQAETFLMRLQRGSGIEGLAAISTVSERENIKIVRPLLDFEPQELRDFLTSRQIKWVEDASNQCDDYLRVRVRKMLPLLENELGLTSRKIASAAAAIGGARDFFALQVKKFIKNHCRNWYNCAWSFNPLTFAGLHSELQFRVVAELIKMTSNAEYPPEYQALKRVCRLMSADDFAGCTLGGCEIVRFQSKIWIIPENQKAEILSTQQWDNFADTHPEVLKNGLPYKLRVYLYEKNRKAVEFEK